MTTPLAFRGGMAGALAPFALFLAGVVWLALAGAPDERGFWPVLLAALALGLLLARDRGAWADAVLGAMAHPVVALMIIAWLLSGVLGTTLAEAGMVDALAWLARRAELGAGAFTAAAFLACAIVSTSTGTSFGTILVAGPLLYPAGGALGADAPLLMGAILAGATWGDSISPVSDTTIASAGSQRTDVPGTVRARLAYVVPAGVLTIVAYGVLASARSVSGVTTAAANGAVTAHPRALWLLLVPVVVIALLVRRRHLLEGLFAGIALALGGALALGLVSWSRVFYIDAEAFGARGLVVDGLGRGVGVAVFTLLLMGLVGALLASGVLERLVPAVARSANDDVSNGHATIGSVSADGIAHSGVAIGGASGDAASPASATHARRVAARRAEWWSVGVVSIAVLLTTHAVVAMLAVGPWVRALGERTGLHAYRRANLLDLTVCTWPFLLPWFLPTILAGAASASGAAFGMPRLSPLTVGLHNVYAWTLLAAVPLAIVTGYGRRWEVVGGNTAGAMPEPVGSA